MSYFSCVCLCGNLRHFNMFVVFHTQNRLRGQKSGYYKLFESVYGEGGSTLLVIIQASIIQENASISSFDLYVWRTNFHNYSFSIL